MTRMPTELAAAVLALLVYTALTMGAGAYLDRKLFRDDIVLVDEKPANEQNQDDGSVILHRDPAAKPETKAPTIPKGGTIARTGEITILPPSVTVTCETSGEEVRAQCPPITARFDIVRMLDGTHRAIASSDDGEILGGIDIPREPAVVTAQHRQYVGVAVFSDGAKQLEVGRRFGRVETSLYVNRASDDAVAAGLGLRLNF